MCSGGIVPDSIAYEQYFDSIISTNTTISFPQFDPAVGVLSCIKLSDTVTTVVSYNLANDLTDSEDYIFETFRRSIFNGPGGFFSSITSPPEDYGPYTLAPSDSVGDNVDIGPDTVFNQRVYQHYGSANAAFYGTGTVDFNYLNTSTFTILTGSDNAIFTLRAYTRLNATLVYYWCPFIVLATHISNFHISRSNDNVSIQWQVENYDPGDKYEVEMSNDGKVFKNLGKGNPAISGSLANYNVPFDITPGFTGKLFFRIKQTNYSNKISYSEIRTIVLNKTATATSYSVYPNPSVTGINIEFAKNTGGNYQVKLINSTGQAVFEKMYAVNHHGFINIEWSKKPVPGIYYLKVKDLKTNVEETAILQVM
jgi:Secretion system C-terminal sorting domain